MKILNNKIFKNKNFLSVFLALIIFIVIFIFNLFQLGNIIDKNIQKSSFNFPGKVDDRIAIVTIDDKTVATLGKIPFDRTNYINLIKNLNKAGATVIGLDIIFAEESKTCSLLKPDDELGKTIQEAGNIVMGGSSLAIQPENNLYKLEVPIPIFRKSILSLGFFDVTENTLNNTAFSVSPNKKFINGDYDYFGISLLRGYFSKIFNDKSYLTEKIKFDDEYMNLKDKIIVPLSYKKYKDILINYSISNFQHNYSFLQISDDKTFKILQEQEGEKFLLNKIVLVGTKVRGIDIFKTPLDDELGRNYGIYIHANFINTVLTRNFSKYLDIKLEIFLIFLFTTLAIYINLGKTGKKLIISNIYIIVIIMVYFYYLQIFQLIPNFLFELILAFLLSAVLSNIAKYILENKEKNKLYLALSGYVSKEVAEEIVSGEGHINLEGDKKRIAIFFSDIEGFTSISEKYSPEKLISFLKEYLTEMSEIIFNNKGFINKYEGDAIMALRGVSSKEENISKSACETALLQKQTLIELNKKWKKNGIPEIKVRIGINTGDAIIGNIGGKKLEFTAIGDNVNLASRLESINKFYSTYICVSESVYQDTKEMYEYRFLDKIKVKGKDIALNIYELIGYKLMITENEVNLINEFGKGISLYNDRQFKKALIIFDKLSNEGDTPSLVYKERCMSFIENPPDKNWDKVWTMMEK